MVTRREVVTAGALGALAAVVEAHPGAEASVRVEQSPETVSAQALKDISEEVQRIRQLMREAFVGPSVAAGVIGDVRKQFSIFLKANQKYPDFCEIGPGVFTELYDWHVRHRQPIEITRTDNRMTIRFMFTGMLLRPEQDPGYVGIPFDRG